jgi:hypothetical protein
MNVITPPPPKFAGRRHGLRLLKRQVREASQPHTQADQRERGQKVALMLLERSVHLGHRRLALQRLCEAVSLGARVSGAHWAYCASVVAQAADPVLQERLRMACQQALCQRALSDAIG